MKKISIPGKFSITGLTTNISIKSRFNISNSSIFSLKTEGEKSYGEEGIVQIERNGRIINVPNARINVYRNGILYDKTKTDNDGKYSLYLQDGVYDIKLFSETEKRTIKNYVVSENNSIKNYRQYVEKGQIKEKNKDVVKFFKYENNILVEDELIYQIEGKMIDEHLEPIVEANIVIALFDSREIIVNITTDDNGRFSFVLEEGKYDIIFRAKDCPAKRISGFLFNGDYGFIDSIKETGLQYREGGEWIWTSK